MKDRASREMMLAQGAELSRAMAICSLTTRLEHLVGPTLTEIEQAVLIQQEIVFTFS